MKIAKKIEKNQLLTAALAIALLLTVICGQQAIAQDRPHALLVQAQAAQGYAAPGNTEPAHLLVVVTDSLTGVPLTDLNLSNFAITSHFSIPGSVCGFSNNINDFGNVGTGAYQIKLGLPVSLPGCSWVKGDYLAEVAVAKGPKTGRATAMLSIK